MAITRVAATQPGSILGYRVLGIMSLKRDNDLGCPSLYAPVPQAWGPICERCWLESDYVRPESSALCPHGGAS
jgi:hypothetical protein